MGNQQYCCNYKPDDPHAQDFNENSKGVTKPKGIKKSGTRDMDELMKEAKKNEEKIIKMQAKVRGFLHRKNHHK